MRICGFLLGLLFFRTVVSAGEIVVYNQKWTGKVMTVSKETQSGKGYILLDLTNAKLVRISTSKETYGGNIYTVDSFPVALIGEPGSTSYAGVYLSVQATLTDASSPPRQQETIYFKGKEALLKIGPSQQKQTARTISGLSRFTRLSYYSTIEETSFSGTFNSSLTLDTNGNSRSIETEAELLTNSLDEAGYSRR